MFLDHLGLASHGEKEKNPLSWFVFFFLLLPCIASPKHPGTQCIHSFCHVKPGLCAQVVMLGIHQQQQEQEGGKGELGQQADRGLRVQDGEGDQDWTGVVATSQVLHSSETACHPVR